MILVYVIDPWLLKIVFLGAGVNPGASCYYPGRPVDFSCNELIISE